MLAASPLLGHLPATALLDRGGYDGIEAAGRAASARAACVPARPPGDVDAGWTVEPARGHARRAPAPTVDGDGDRRAATVAVGARRARRRRARRRRDRGRRRARRRGRRRGADGVEVEPRRALRRDPRRSATCARRRARARVLDVDAGRRSRAPGTSRRRCIAAESRRRGRGVRSRWRVAVREGALHVRPRRSAPTRRSSTRSSRCCAGWRTRARCSTTPAGRARPARRVRRSPPAPRASAAGARARLRRARRTSRARRHRRDVGARRAAVLPPRAALAAAARRDRRRDRPRGDRGARRRDRRLTARRGGAALTDARDCTHDQPRRRPDPAGRDRGRGAPAARARTP